MPTDLLDSWPIQSFWGELKSKIDNIFVFRRFINDNNNLMAITLNYALENKNEW